MRVVLQRVKYAQVKVNDACIGKIEKGFMLLVGITQDDTLETIQKVAKKCAGLRIFEDEEGKMNLSLHNSVFRDSMNWNQERKGGSHYEVCRNIFRRGSYCKQIIKKSP